MHTQVPIMLIRLATLSDTRDVATQNLRTPCPELRHQGSNPRPPVVARVYGAGGVLREGVARVL